MWQGSGKALTDEAIDKSVLVVLWNELIIFQTLKLTS
jgi:hypothetical protein